MLSTQKITTHLWFNGNAEEAVEFYTSVFPDSRVTKVARWGEGGPGPQGTVLNIAFELAGQGFIALNGGPQYRFTPAISLFVSCESQAEVDDAVIDLMSDPAASKTAFSYPGVMLPRSATRITIRPCFGAVVLSAKEAGSALTPAADFSASGP